MKVKAGPTDGRCAHCFWLRVGYVGAWCEYQGFGWGWRIDEDSLQTPKWCPVSVRQELWIGHELTGAI